MADGKSKPKENPNGQPEVPKLGEIRKPENVQQIAGEKTEVKKEATKGTSEIKREVLQMEVNPDKETPSKIEKLDVSGNLESKEQKEGFDLLQTVAGTTLLAMLFDQGVKKETLKTFENIGSVGGPALAKLNPAERVSLKKLQEISAKPGTTLYVALKERWNKLVDRAHEIYDGAKKAKQSIESPKTKNTVAGQAEKEPTTLWGKIGGFVKEHPVLAAGIAIGGAFAVYKIFKWFTKSGDESGSGEKKEGFMDKILGNKWASRIKWGLGVSAGIFVLGRLIGNEDVGKWLKDHLGINITGNRLSQFLILLSHGEFINAFKVLLAGPDENFDVHRRMAEKIGKETGTKIDPETLKGIGGMKYEEFMSTIAQGKSAIAGVLGQIPGLNLLVGSSASAEQEQAVRKYFETHEEEIKRFKNPTTTVDNVLVNLDGASEGKTILPPEIAAINADIEKLPPEVKSAVQEMQKDMASIFPEAGFIEVLTQCKKTGINTKKLEELHLKLKQAEAEWGNAVKNCKSLDDLPNVAEKAQKLHEVSDELCVEVNKMTNELKYRRGWTEAELLAASQSWKIYRFLTQPPWRKEYAKYIVGKYLKKPFEIGKDIAASVKGIPNAELIGKEFKPNAPGGEIENDLKKTQEELKTARDKQTNLDKDVNAANEISVNEQKLNKSTIELLEKDLKINETRKSITDFQSELEKLKANKGSTARIAELERAIEQDQSMLRRYMNERLGHQAEFLKWNLKDQRLNFDLEFGANGREKPITKSHLEKMDAIAESVVTHRKQVELQIAEKMREAEELAKAQKPIKEIAKEINELRKTQIILDVGALENANKITTNWRTEWDLRTAMKGGVASKEVEDVMKTEKNQIQKTFSKILNGQQGGPSAKKLLTSNNLKLMGLFIGVGSVINFIDQNETKNFSKAIGQATIDTLPFISTASDIYSAASGEEWISGRKLDAKDRGLRAAFALGGALCDASELAGVFMSARSAYGVAKEARATGKSMKFAEALKASKGDVNSIEALREMSATGHWTMKMAMGGALGLMGYELIWKPVANVELSKQTIETLGDQVQNTNIPVTKIDAPLKKL